MIAAIIPAYNEEKNIASVIRAFQKSPLISEIIVVSDGSTDSTGAVAREEGARVIVQANAGKAAAMTAGARATRAGILFFADADLLGFTHTHIETVLSPMMNSGAGMTVGLRDRGPLMWPLLQHVFLVIGGERAISRTHFLNIAAHPAARRFGIESVMNAYCKKHRIPVILVPMHAVTQVVKERKYGVIKGFTARIRMIRDIVRTECAMMNDRML